ncbi:hypothetical protein ACOME3_010095 [Neoechinorhynchus agilis]
MNSRRLKCRHNLNDDKYILATNNDNSELWTTNEEVDCASISFIDKGTSLVAINRDFYEAKHNPSLGSVILLDVTDKDDIQFLGISDEMIKNSLAYPRAMYGKRLDDVRSKSS